jgi:type 1 glutamine amidotransferase
MGVIRYDGAPRVLVSTRGHPFERDPFFAMLTGAAPDLDFVAVEQPASQHFFHPERAREFAAFLLYDMPGVDLLSGYPPRQPEPPAAYREAFEALVESGHGFVFLHHALAGWPAWPRYGEWVGGRFLYAPGEVRGRPWPDSGYRHDVTHRLTPCDPDHPVVSGLEAGFEITDELYLCPVFEDDVTPLLRSDHAFSCEGFYSAAEALQGRMYSNEGWSHPPGSSLVAWTQQHGSSTMVTILCGDAPPAYASPGLRRLISNALHFVAR